MIEQPPNDPTTKQLNESPSIDSTLRSDSIRELLPSHVKPLSFSAATISECLMGVVGIALGLVGWSNSDAPLWHADFAAGWWIWLGYGLLATIPLVVMLIVSEKMTWPALTRFREFYVPLIRTLFGQMSIWQLALVSLSAGVGEELLFRWCLQGGLANALGNWMFGWLTALIVASVLFGFAHFVTWGYVIWAGLIGVYLGWLFEYTDNWLIPAVAHALYDFIALVYLVRFARSADSSSIQNHGG